VGGEGSRGGKRRKCVGEHGVEGMVEMKERGGEGA